MIKTFAIYCSGNASRVLKFYSYQNNIYKYKPSKIIYDGNKINIIEKLKNIFHEDLILLETSKLNQNEIKKIHNTTSEFIHNTLNQNEIEFLLCFGDKILKKELINAYPNKLINFHPSILPSFKGLNAIDQALKFGAIFLGNTAHYINENIDSGKIIAQTTMLKEEFISYEDVLELQFPMIKIILRDILNYKISNNEILNEVSKRKTQFLISKKCQI